MMRPGCGAGAFEAILVQRLAEHRDEPSRGREHGPEAELAGLESEGDDEVRLANAGRTERQHILPVRDEASRRQFLDDLGIELSVPRIEAGNALAK
jgi:hypothetical protein